MTTYNKCVTVLLLIVIAAMMYDVKTTDNKACAIMGSIQCGVAK